MKSVWKKVRKSIQQLPTISFRDLIRKVEKMGFQRIRQKGSHIRFSHPDERKVTIPDHGSKDVPRGLFVKIVRHDLELNIEEFLRMSMGSDLSCVLHASVSWLGEWYSSRDRGLASYRTVLMTGEVINSQPDS